MQGIFNGIVGAALTAVVAVVLHFLNKRRSMPTGRAYEIIAGLGKTVSSHQGQYYLSASPSDNYQVVSHVFAHAEGQTIATAFREDPATYGHADLARNFQFGGSLFTRLTCEDVCQGDSAQKAQASLASVLPGAQFVIVPRQEFATKIDGLFCKLRDGTFLAFMTFPKLSDLSRNRGVLFHDGIARSLFEYYADLVTKHRGAASGDASPSNAANPL